MNDMLYGLHSWGAAHIGAAWPYLFTLVKTLVLIICIVAPIMLSVAYTTLFRSCIQPISLRSYSVV